MPHPAVAVDLHQPLDVEADVLAEIALHLPLVRNDLPDLPHIILGQILDPRLLADAGGAEDAVRAISDTLKALAASATSAE